MELEEADRYLIKANLTLQRVFPTGRHFVDNLLRRNWWQVKDAKAVYAVGFLSGRQVVGGTAWAVQMYRDQYAPLEEPEDLFLFDQIKGNWMRGVVDGEWVVMAKRPPKPLGIWAGIGSRDLRPAAMRAMEELF
jgi:hypothetical protein